MKPVTLVSTVVERNSVVHFSTCFPASIPYTNTRPAAIPMRLRAVCTMVKVANDMPNIM